MSRSKADLKRREKGVILQGYIEVPQGQKLPTGRLVPVEIILVSTKHYWDTRNQRIVSMKKEDPTLSLQAIALIMGVTRQRVHQILKVNGVTTKRRYRKRPLSEKPFGEFEEM